MSDFIIITKARVLENEPEEIIKEQEEERKGAQTAFRS